MYSPLFHLFCVVLAILPFSKAIMRFEVGVITLNPYLLGVLALFPFALLGLLRRPWMYGIRATDVCIAMLGTTYLASTLQSPNVLDSGFLAFHALFIPALSYFLIKSFVTTEAEYQKAMGLFVASITVFSPIVVASFFIQGQRPTVFTIHSIGIATLAVFVLIHLCVSGKAKSMLGYLALMAVLAGFLVTLSRVYMLLLVIAPAIYWQIRKGRGLTIFVATFLVTLLVTLFLAASSEMFLWDDVNEEEARTVTRLVDLDFWKRALYARTLDYADGLANFKEHLYFGVGLYKGEVVITRHNFHIEWLEYGGLVGHALYTAVILFHVGSGARWARRDRLLAGNMLALLLIIGNSFTNGLMHGTMPYVAFIVMGFSEARITILSRAQRRRRHVQPTPFLFAQLEQKPP